MHGQASCFDAKQFLGMGGRHWPTASAGTLLILETINKLIPFALHFESSGN